MTLSITDDLTGCQNRRAYEEKILEFSKTKPDEDFVYVSRSKSAGPFFEESGTYCGVIEQRNKIWYYS